MAASPGLRGRPAHDPEDRIAPLAPANPLPIGEKGRVRGALVKGSCLFESEFGAGAAPEPQAEFRPDLDSLAHGALAAAAPLGRAIVRQQQPVQYQPSVRDRREPADW